MDEANEALVREVFERAPLMRLFGVELVAFGHGWCETRLQLREEFMQQHGFAHAGTVMALMDHTCGGAAASTALGAKSVITVENTFYFLRPAVGTELRCRASVVRAGKSIAFTEGQAEAVDGDQRIAVARAMSVLSFVDLPHA